MPSRFLGKPLLGQRVTDILALADLPPIEVLRSKLLGVIMAPATKLAAVISTPATQLVRVLKARVDKGE